MNGRDIEAFDTKRRRIERKRAFQLQQCLVGAVMMDAKGIDYTKLAGEGSSDFDVASADGRGFAVSGGVATAVANAIHRVHPDREVKVANAEGLSECRKMMKMATKGKYDGYLLEGMA